MTMKKNIDLVIDGIAPEKVMYDTDNHSLVVLYPAQEEFKKGDILASGDTLLIFDKYETLSQENDLFYSIWNNANAHNRNWTPKCLTHATDKQIAQLHEDLRKEGKKWNEEKLQVEDLDIKPEFKRGDILTAVGVGHDKSNMTFIYNHFDKYSGHFEALCGGVQINPATKKSQLRDTWFKYGFNKDKVRHATPSEIEQFDNDLKKIGKKWNRETLQVEELDISEIVVDWLSACEYLNKPMPKNYVYEPNSDFEKQINAQITLQLIREAWNKFDRFVVDYANSEQDKCFPILDVYGDIGYLILRRTTHISGSCYSFKTKERAIQFGKQFKDLFKTAMGL